VLSSNYWRGRFPGVRLPQLSTQMHPMTNGTALVKCLWEVFVWGFGVLFLSCVCVPASGVLFSVGVCVCV